MSVHCFSQIFESQFGSPESIESRPVIMPGNDAKGRSKAERNTKLVRILTVVAYVCSVSIAAAMLSLYYVFIWDPSNHQNNVTSYPSGSSTNPVTTYIPYHQYSGGMINTTTVTTTVLPLANSSNSPLLRPLLGNCTDGMFRFDHSLRRHVDFLVYFFLVLLHFFFLFTVGILLVFFYYPHSTGQSDILDARHTICHPLKGRNYIRRGADALHISFLSNPNSCFFFLFFQSRS